MEPEIVRSDPILRWYLACIAFDQRLWVMIVKNARLLVVPVVLFGIFAVITCKEDRFDFGSRDLPPFPGSRDVIVGLSFLGDTMVWPFFFLVPLFLVLLRSAIGNTAALLRDRTTLVRPEVLNNTGLARLDQIKNEALEQLCYRGSAGRNFWRFALAVGLITFVYNAVVCVRADAWPSSVIPYDHVWAWLKPNALHDAVLKPDAVVVVLKDPAPLISPCGDRNQDVCLPPGLSKKLAIDHDRRRLTWSGPLSIEERGELADLWPGPEWQQMVQSLYRQKNRGFASGKLQPFEKWDTDLTGAPFTWWASRLWVLLLGYAILPLAALRILNILFVVWSSVKALAEADMLKANPYSSESRKSLELIVTALFGANYCLFLVSGMVALAFLRGSGLEWHDWLLVAFIPIFAAAAAAPLLLISNIFERQVKERYLSVHARAVEQMHRTFRASAETETDDNKARLADAATKYDDYLSRGQAAAVFPLSLTTITNLAAPVTPMVVALVEKAAETFF